MHPSPIACLCLFIIIQTDESHRSLALPACFSLFPLRFSFLDPRPADRLKYFPSNEGEFKAVNFERYLAGNLNAVVAANTTVTGALHFNNTKLNSTPRVILALKSYGVIPSSAITSLPIGYMITITSKNSTNLTYSLTTYGAAIVALHYQYLAVVGYNNVFCLQFYSVPRTFTIR